MTTGKIIAEALTALYPEINKQQRKLKIKAVMEKVGLLKNRDNGKKRHGFLVCA